MTDTIKPATDEDIANYDGWLDDNFVEALFARIRAEQAAKEEALQTANMATYLAARHNAILECISALDGWMEIPHPGAIKDRLSQLLQSGEEQ